MFFPSALACSQPNSSTPLSAAANARQARHFARVARSFTRGNRALDDIMRGLTPPVASPSCGDLKTSAGLRTSSPARARATYGALQMPIVGGPSAGVSAPLGNVGVSGVRRGRGMGAWSGSAWNPPLSTPGVAEVCADPIVLPVDTVSRPPDGSASRSPAVLPAAAAGYTSLEWWQWGLLAVLAAATVYEVSKDDNSRA